MPSNNDFYIGVDVGGTKLLAGLINGRGRILAREKTQTPFKSAPRQVFDKISTLIRGILKNSPDIKIKGMGLGIPGIISHDGREILRTPNINLARFPLRLKLAAAFRVPVVLGNDVNCGLTGEKWLGAAKNAANVVGIFPGTGVGGAIILNGKIYTGSQGAAAELGHMIMDYNSPVCHSGIFGSLEALASRQAIERNLRQAVKAGRKTAIVRLTEGKLKVIKSKIIAKALKLNDRVIKNIMDEVCLILGKACISLRHTLNPDMIVFGGGLIEACGFYMLPKIRKISDADPFFKNIDRCKIAASETGDDAVILGAVKSVIDKLTS